MKSNLIEKTLSKDYLTGEIYHTKIIDNLKYEEYQILIQSKLNRYKSLSHLQVSFLNDLIDTFNHKYITL